MIDLKIEYGHHTTDSSYFEGKVVSRVETMRKSYAVDSMIDAQRHMIEMSRLLLTDGVSHDVTFRLIADKGKTEPRRIEVQWISEKYSVPVNKGIAETK